MWSCFITVQVTQRCTWFDWLICYLVMWNLLGFAKQVLLHFEGFATNFPSIRGLKNNQMKSFLSEVYDLNETMKSE